MAQNKGSNRNGSEKPASNNKTAYNRTSPDKKNAGKGTAGKSPNGKGRDPGKTKSGLIFVASLILIGVLVITLAIVFLKGSDSSGLKDLPNYTEIKGDYTAEGLKYEKQPHLGDPNAKVKVIEFADFKCPACKKWDETYMTQLQKDFIDTGKIELFFTNYAFIDRDSIMAASAGEAIAAQSNEKFWEFKSKLYEHQGDETKIWATPGFLLDFVKKNLEGIDYERFEKDLKEHTYMLPVKEDFKTAGYYGVNGTPQFMVNGELLPSASYEELAAAIEAELAKAGGQ
ncbi:MULTISPECIES: DsbA family protein [Paenibacillus]|uniref:DsbA family protein n=1 Tax=Paenibacillus TaxID=44249 RepID=UPI00073F375F|nr:MULTISPECIES: thioredoxin domain-containing protein [Paenibacillus]MDU4694351.1 thioredoxin domain-containing protein [Paenibacillus sp.]